MFSQIDSVEDAVYAHLLAADLSGDGIGEVTVELGTPTVFTDDNVWVDDNTEEWTSTYALSGLAAKEEQFPVRVIVMCQRDDTYAAVRNVTLSLADKVAARLTGDPFLAGKAQLAAFGAYRKESAMLSDGKRVVKVSMTLVVDAWIPTPA